MKKIFLKGTDTDHSINHKEALAETRYMLALWSLQLIEPSALALFLLFCIDKRMSRVEADMAFCGANVAF
jgi:hypothetical protein